MADIIINNSSDNLKYILDSDNTTTGARVKDLENKVGDLSNLKTTKKDTIVNAINEAKESGTTVEIVDNLTSTDTNKALSANQGKKLNTTIGDLTTLKTTKKDSVVNAINEIKENSGNIEIIDNLTSEDTEKALSANQGKILNEKIIGTKGKNAESEIVMGAEIFNDYVNNKAYGLYSHAEGVMTWAMGKGSHAEGRMTTANSEASSSHGFNTVAGSKAFKITAFDRTNKAYTLDSVEGLAVDDVFSLQLTGTYLDEGKITAIDTTNKKVTVDSTIFKGKEGAEDNYFMVLVKPGIGTVDFGKVAFTEGTCTQAFGSYSHAEGNMTRALGEGAHVEGYQVKAVGRYSHAEGGNTKEETEAIGATGDYSHVEGMNTNATAMYSHAEGYETNAYAQGAHAEGSQTIASGNFSHAEGQATQALASNAHAGGSYTQALSQETFVHGDNAMAGTKLIAITSSDKNTKSYVLETVENLAVGDKFSLYCMDASQGNKDYIYDNYGKIVSIDSSTRKIIVDNYIMPTITSGPKYFRIANKPTIGTSIFKIGNQAFAVGYNTKASGTASHAEGYFTVAGGNYSHVEGKYSSALGTVSHAEGESTTADGSYSHAEGFFTSAQSENSHAEGNFTQAIGENSHAEGNNTQAIGKNSHAEGSHTKAQGENSHAEGEGTETTIIGSVQHVEGRYNVIDTYGKYLHIVGKGISDTDRSNAHTLDQSGNAWFAGEITVGGDPSTDNHGDFARKVVLKDTILSNNYTMLEATSNTLTLRAEMDYRFTSTALTTLIIALPTTVSNDFYCYLTFLSGATGTTITDTDTNIRWVGADCNLQKKFTPVADTIYEIGFKCVGMDSENKPIIVARVGAC